MMRSAALLALCTVSACTTIKINPGDTETIVYEGGVDVANDLTTRACRKAGQRSAEIISTVNKDPKLPAGTGRQVTTFRCSAAEPPQQQ
ncbi:MAG TPA: hypothetical protein VGN07_17965 [Steroidobacteraceae bacterium]|jgi:hypothetical protein